MKIQFNYVINIWIAEAGLEALLDSVLVRFDNVAALAAVVLAAVDHLLIAERDELDAAFAVFDRVTTLNGAHLFTQTRDNRKRLLCKKESEIEIERERERETNRTLKKKNSLRQRMHSRRHNRVDCALHRRLLWRSS
jgi:hypothetical protein